MPRGHEGNAEHRLAAGVRHLHFPIGEFAPVFGQRGREILTRPQGQLPRGLDIRQIHPDAVPGDFLAFSKVKIIPVHDTLTRMAL